MTRIALVVSDVDGTLLTKNKTLTEGAKAAVQRLHEAGIGFTITSSRPTIGMRFLIERSRSRCRSALSMEAPSSTRR